MAAARAAANLAAVHDCEPAVAEFRAVVLHGLSLAQKAIPAKFFYDHAGSRLFGAICALDEYYPTRCEIAILEAAGPEIAALLPDGAVVIELGSGAGIKSRLLLAALRAPAAYVPVEIAREALVAGAAAIARDLPALAVRPVCADFVRGLPLPDGLPAGRRVAFFPGSTIGNFHPPDAVALLRTIRAALGAGGHLVIGVDRDKDPAVLHRAYNDPAGVTAAFNLNLLMRINRELGANFEPQRFAHRAFYNARAGRIEMHLVSTIAQTVTVAGRAFRFAAGETIHTENSYKYADAAFRALAARAGFATVAIWTDRDALFAVHALRAEP